MAAGVDEEARELEVARLAGVAVELDERGLDLGVPGRALVAAGAEDLADVVGEPAGDVEQPRVAGAARVGDRRLDQVAGAVELVVPGEVHEALGPGWSTWKYELR